MTAAHAEPTNTTAVVGIDVKSVDSYIPGCGNCGRSATRTPVFVSSEYSDVLSGALKVVTFGPPPNLYDFATSAGGCAISAARTLLCWGANGAGQLGDGTTTTSSVPKSAIGISEVTDVAASGGTTCAVSGGDLLCVGVGPWPDGSSSSTKWIKVSDEIVASVHMGTHISSNSRSPICVVTGSAHFKCLRSTNQTGSQPEFQWIDSGLTSVTAAASSLMYYPGQANICVLASDQIVCGTVDKNGAFSLQRRITSESKFTRLYMFNSQGFPVVCGWKTELLSCGMFSYDPSAPYAPPSGLRVIGVVPEPLSLAYKSVDSIERIYIFHSRGVLYFNSNALRSTTYTFGSNDSIIAPVLGWKATAADSSVAVASVAGPTDSTDIIPVSIQKSTRTLLGSRLVTLTASGSPIIGAKVAWATTDDPTILQSSSSAAYVTDDSGHVRFPQMASGMVTFTVTGGKVADGAFLQTAVATVDVNRTSEVAVQLPPSPVVVTRQLSIQLPDSTPVPNAEVRLRNAFLTYGFVTSASSRAAWTAQRPDAMGYLSPVACAFCMVNPPTYLSDDSGIARIPVFADAPSIVGYDASVSYDDGTISQSANVESLATDAVVNFQFMQTIRLTTTQTVDVRSGGTAEITGSLTDDLGIPMQGVSISASPVCNELAFGGLWSQGNKLSTVACPRNFVGTINKAEVGLAQSRCGDRGKTDSRGSISLRVCAQRSMLLRLESPGNVSSRTICIRVDRLPCQLGYNQISAEAASLSIPLRVKAKATFGSIAKTLGIVASKGSRVALTLDSLTDSHCRSSGGIVLGQSRGFCPFHLTVTSKARKPARVEGLIKVS